MFGGRGLHRNRNVNIIQLKQINSPQEEVNKWEHPGQYFSIIEELVQIIEKYWQLDLRDLGKSFLLLSKPVYSQVYFRSVLKHITKSCIFIFKKCFSAENVASRVGILQPWFSPRSRFHMHLYGCHIHIHSQWFCTHFRSCFKWHFWKEQGNLCRR